MLPETLPDGAEQRPPVFELDAAGAERGTQGQRKADGEVDEADCGDAERGPQHGLERQRKIEGGQGIAEIGRGEGNMPDIERQAEDGADDAG
ncbi:hypothetical protein D3C86_1999130 [compost metagenome]